MRDRLGKDFLDYDSLSVEEIERLAHDGLVNFEPPIDSDFFLDDQFSRRAYELNRKPYAGVQKVSQLELRNGPWDGNNQLGNQVEFAPDANNEQTVFKMDTWGMPQVWSVMLGYTVPVATGARFEIVGEITAGAGGAVQEFEVDWNRGSSFTVVANALNIVARYGESSSIPDGVQLRVIVGRHPLGRAKPTRTLFLSVNSGGAVEFATIPAFATSFRVLASDGTVPHVQFTSSFNIRVLSGTSAGLVLLDVPGNEIDSIYGNNIPIPAGGNSIRVQNSGASTANTRFVFSLGL